MKTLLEFDDAGAQDAEPVKGVTIGDIRAWHDQYDNLLTSWAECRALLSDERCVTETFRGAMQEILDGTGECNSGCRGVAARLLSPLPRCNHWPGQPRCGVCGMGFAANQLTPVAECHSSQADPAITTGAAGGSPALKGLEQKLIRVHRALDDALGDSDVTHIEDDDELRRQYPTQWAAEQLAKIIDDL